MAKKRAAEIKRLAESLSTKPEEMPPPPVPKKTRKAKADPPVPPEKSDESEKPQKKRKTPSKAIDGDAPKDGGTAPKKVPPKKVPPAKAEEHTYETVDSEGKKSLQAPDFPISWDNHHRLMDFYNISEAEATSILLNVVGPHPNGQAFWDRFRSKQPIPPATDEEPIGSPKSFTRAEEEFLNDSQLPPIPSPESVASTSVESSGGNGSFIDQVETQQMAEMVPEPKVPVPADPPQPSKVGV